MSDFYRPGDLVSMVGGDGGIPISLPLNQIYPLMWAICDCEDEGCVYVPYRVYTGDNVIVKPILEGDALIPEDVSGTGKFKGGTLQGTSYATESAVSNGCRCNNQYQDVYDNTGKYLGKQFSCPAYGSLPGKCKTSPGQFDWTPGFTGKLPCDYCTWLGWTVSGSDSRTNGADNYVEVGSLNGYEYIELAITGGTFGDAGEEVHWRYPKLPPYKCKFSIGNGVVRVEAYPGHGGVCGLPASMGGYVCIGFYVIVSGGKNSHRTEMTVLYTCKTKSVTFTLKNTGRYGDYR